MIWNAHDDDPRFEQQVAFYEEGGLTVQELVPHFGHDELGNHNCDHALYPIGSELSNVVGKRASDVSEW